MSSVSTHPLWTFLPRAARRLGAPAHSTVTAAWYRPVTNGNASLAPTTMATAQDQPRWPSRWWSLLHQSLLMSSVSTHPLWTFLPRAARRLGAPAHSTVTAAWYRPVTHGNASLTLANVGRRRITAQASAQATPTAIRPRDAVLGIARLLKGNASMHEKMSSLASKVPVGPDRCRQK